jgi:hypothetical protein
VSSVGIVVGSAFIRFEEAVSHVTAKPKTPPQEGTAVAIGLCILMTLFPLTNCLDFVPGVRLVPTYIVKLLNLLVSSLAKITVGRELPSPAANVLKDKGLTDNRNIANKTAGNFFNIKSRKDTLFKIALATG